MQCVPCLQDMEVTYFRAYIDGVDFVFMDTPMFRNKESNIYGGNRLVCYIRKYIILVRIVVLPLNSLTCLCYHIGAGYFKTYGIILQSSS